MDQLIITTGLTKIHLEFIVVLRLHIIGTVKYPCILTVPTRTENILTIVITNVIITVITTNITTSITTNITTNITATATNITATDINADVNLIYF